MTIQQTLDEREKTHGDYEFVAHYSQAIKDIIRNTDNYRNMTPEAKEALDNIAQKIARIIEGNWQEKDHWRDIIGYATLVERILP